MKKFVNQLLTPTGILAIFFFLLPWQTRYIFGLSHLSGSFTQFGILSLYATQLFLILGLAFAYLLRGSPVIEPRYRRSIMLGVAIMVITIVSSFLAQQSIPALAALIDLTGAGIAFIALLDKRVNLQWVMSAFVAGLLIPVGIGLVQVFFGETGASTVLGLASRDATRLGDAVLMLADGERVLRAYGTFPHPNNFGGYLAVGLLTTLALPFTGARKARAIIAAVLAIGLALTASRSALLGLILGGGLTMLAQRWPWRWAGPSPAPTAMTIAIGVVGLALGVTLFAPSLAASLRGGGALEDRSLSERADQYREWPATMQGSDWLIGSGPRSYVFTLATIHPDRGVWEYQPIHNVPLLVLAEIGLLGLIAMIAWIVTLDRQNFARFPNREAAYAHGMGKVLFVIIFFDHYLWSSWAGLVLVAYVAALMLRLGEEKVVDETRKIV
jgi:O-antigen ligase